MGSVCYEKPLGSHIMRATDYQSLIDAQTWAFIAATGAHYPPDTASLPIDRQRAIYDAMTAAFRGARPTGISAQDHPCAGVPCRHYARTGSGGAEDAPTVIYFHGGGFVVGGLHSHDDICAEICDATGFQVVAVDYRLCPEHPHPAAFDDCMAVVLAIPGPLLLVGDSAGGTLAAAVAAELRGDRVRGQVLIYPWLGGDTARASYIAHANAPMLTAADVRFYAAVRHGGSVPAAPDPTANPLSANDFSALPPTLAIAAQCDPLADDAPAYASAITAAGGRAHAITEPGLVHGYLRARHSVPRAAASFARITATLSAFGIGHWPFGDTP